MADIVLEGIGVTQRFGGLVAVDSVDFNVRKNEIVGIIGPNGAGKTTLFNNITGIYKATSGKIMRNGIDITGLPPHKITSMGLARTFQNIRLFPNLMAIDNVILGMHSKLKSGFWEAILQLPRVRRENKESVQKAEELLKLTGLYDYRYNYANSLPYGLQRRLEIARAMASDADILLIDEPAAGMNEQETEDLMAFIRELKGMGFTIVLIEHDMHLVMNICERIYVLDYGKLIAHGIPEQIQQNQAVIEAYLGKDDEDEELEVE